MSVLDGSEFFECECGCTEHTMRFILNYNKSDPDEPPMIYTMMFVTTHHSWFVRLKRAIKYLFGVKPAYGHFDEWILQGEDLVRLRDMCQKVMDSRKMEWKVSFE